MESILLNKKLIVSEQFEDGYHTVLKELKIEHDEDNYPNFIYDSKTKHLSAEIISIDLLVSKLLNYKEAGANYIEIDWHSDHSEYEIEAFDINPLTDEQVVEINKQKEENKRNLAGQQILAIEKQLDNLKLTYEKNFGKTN